MSILGDVIIRLNLEGGMGMRKNPRLRDRGSGSAKSKWITLFMLMFSFIMTSMTLTAWGGPIALPRTGQTTCYNEAGTEIACAGTGQDGDLQAGVVWPSPRFTDNGDGTITDNLTGLMWLSDANCMATHYPEFDADVTPGDGLVEWVHADDFVNKINKGTYPLCGAGRTDWRFPNAIELESLFDAGKNDPMAWLTSEGFSNVGNGYWSSTTYFANPTYGNSRFVFNSFIGVVTYHDPFFIDEVAVWPVRGTTSGPAQLWKTGQTTTYAPADDGDLQEGVAWPDPRFTDNGDGTITDNLTGLTWLRDMNCILSHYPSFDTDGLSGDGAVSWQHALDFVRGINRGTYPSCGAGYRDWRLPNIRELMSICHYGGDTYAWLLSQGFTNPDRTVTYWSSTTFLSWSFTPDALELLWDCSVNPETKIAGEDNVGVWPVRGGAILESISTPSPPSGMTTGVTGVSYAYSTGDSVSNLGSGHPIEYQFNWGDQTTSEWSSSGSASHSWSSPGIYNITAQARCAIDHEVVSSWSDQAKITIAPEQISPPSIPSGQTLGTTETLYSFSTGGSLLNSEHPVEYQFNWGDQTLSGWSSSGSAQHSWSSPGIFHITAQARCAIDHQVVSSWSDEASITINLPSGPDLTGTWTYLTQTCKTSKSVTKCKITGELVIQNIGTQNAPSSVVKFYLSDDGVYDEQDTFLKQATIGKMKAKATKTTKLTYTLATSVLGKYIIAVIDADHTVNEQYETNNNIAFGPIK